MMLFLIPYARIQQVIQISTEHSFKQHRYLSDNNRTNCVN
uniref:Uncharacterized protein n=1 Tax=Arundo donax TaxID=35708 RepID=A0A0A8YQH0_ARUDO